MATTKITNPELFDLGSLNTALKLPSGTTAQRPTSPSTGEWRYNTTNNVVEFYDGTQWRVLQSEEIPPIPSEHFSAVLYTGNNSTNAITGVGFKPDLVWIKNRNTAGTWHQLFDSTRGQNALASNTNGEQVAEATNGVRSFDADGFTVAGTGGYTNASGDDYVAWCWKAGGGTTSSNTDGTITSTVQANTKAGFSVVTYNGSGNADTVGHGLGAAPKVVIIKRTNGGAGFNWINGGAGLSWTGNQTLSFDNNGSIDTWNYFNATAPTSTVFYLGTGANTGSSNDNAGTYIAYCFAEKSGYSKFDTYTGNGSTNGPIVNTGFEPAFLIVKRTDSSANWRLLDNKRSPSNPRQKTLFPNLDNAESNVSGDAVNFLSNGFQIINNDTSWNASGGTYIYMAFAADPSAAPVLADSFANKLWTGNDGTNAISGLGFQPSFVWIKRRVSGSESHALYDMLRGVNEQLSSDSTAAQILNTAPNEGFSSFDTDGFTLGNNGGTNRAPNTYVGWSWKASPVPTSNTDGTIQSLVSANQAAGFSISKWTGNGSAATIGHGLSATPEMIITKRLTGISPWYTYNAYLNGGANPAYYFVNLNTSDAETNNGSSGGSIFNSTPPTSTIFNIGTSLSGSVDDYIAYCFHSVSGYSKFGSYVGNATSNRAITGLGFQPNFVMLKNTASTTFWSIFDSSRGGSLALFPNTSQVEANETGVFVSFDSDGFTVNQEPTANGSGNTIIYMAFKENPTP